jgi:hypothetical protein
MIATLVRQLKRAAKTRASLRSERRGREARVPKRAAASPSLDSTESLVDTIYHDTQLDERYVHVFNYYVIIHQQRQPVERYWWPDSRILRMMSPQSTSLVSLRFRLSQAQ